MHGVGAHVADFQDPLFAESALNGQVPLLGVRRDEMAWHGQAKEKLGWNDAWAAACAHIVGEVGGIIVHEAVENAQAGDKVGIENTALRQVVRGREEKVAQAACRPASKRDGKKWGLEAELVHSADVFASEVNAEASANGGGLVSAEVVSETNARSETSRVIVLIGRVAAGRTQAREVKAFHATAVDEGILAAVGQILIQVADVALIVVKTAEDFHAQAQVQSQISTDLPIVLAEEGEIVGAVFVIEDAAAAEAKVRRADEQLLEIGSASGVIDEEQLSVEDLRKEFVEIDAGEVASEPPYVGAFHPAHGIHKVVIVLRLKLVGRRRGPDLESGSSEGEFVNGFRDVVGRALNAQVGGGHGRNVEKAVVDPHVAEPEVVDQRGREQVGLIDGEKARGHGQVVGKIQVCCADAAGESAAQGGLQAACAKGEKRLGIGEEESEGNFVPARAELAIPVGSELVVGVLSGLGSDEGSGGVTGLLSRIQIRRAYGRDEEAAWVAELVALELEQRERDGINIRGGDGETCGAQGGGDGGSRAVRGQRRESRVVDLRARRESAALPRALVVHKEKAEFLLYNRPTQTAAKNVLLDCRTLLARGVQEKFVGFQDIVAEELINIAMEFLAAGLQNGVDVSAAIAALAGVVERSLHFEFLNHVGIGQRHVGGLRDVVVGGADALNEVVVIVLALAVDDHANVAASELRRSVELALRARGQREQLLVVLGGQRQLADGRSANGLAGSGVGGFHAGDLRGDFHFFGDGTGFQREGDARGFRDAHLDARHLGFGKAGFVHDHGVGAGRQQGREKFAVGVGRQLAHDRFRAVVDDLHFRAADGATGCIHHGAADGPRRAALGVRARTGQQRCEQRHSHRHSTKTSHIHPRIQKLHSPQFVRHSPRFTNALFARSTSGHHAGFC